MRDRVCAPPCFRVAEANPKTTPRSLPHERFPLLAQKRGHAPRHAPTNKLAAESSYLEDFPRSEEEFPLLEEFTLFWAALPAALAPSWVACLAALALPELPLPELALLAELALFWAASPAALAPSWVACLAVWLAELPLLELALF